MDETKEQGDGRLSGTKNNGKGTNPLRDILVKDALDKQRQSWMSIQESLKKTSFDLYEYKARFSQFIKNIPYYNDRNTSQFPDEIQTLDDYKYESKIIYEDIQKLQKACKDEYDKIKPHVVALGTPIDLTQRLKGVYENIRQRVGKIELLFFGLTHARDISRFSNDTAKQYVSFYSTILNDATNDTKDLIKAIDNKIGILE